MIPEEDPAEVEAALRKTIQLAAAAFKPPRGGSTLRVEVKRLLLSHALKPLAGNAALVQALQRNERVLDFKVGLRENHYRCRRFSRQPPPFEGCQEGHKAQ